MSRKQTILDRVMAEHIRMPGMPQLIVTRGFAWEHFSALGWIADKRGRESLDRMVFTARETDEALTDETVRDSWLDSLRDHMAYKVAA